MESNAAGVLQDPILQGFSRLKIELRSGDTKTKLLMDMGRIISKGKLQGLRDAFSISGNPIMDNIHTYLNRSGYRLAWEKIVLLGCSAGGNVALRTLFKNTSVPHIPILIAIHHNPGFQFTTKFEMENSIMTSVTSAKDGQPIRGSHIYFLPGDQNICYSSGTASFSMRKIMEKQRFRPVIDKVITDAASRFRQNLFVAIMSGMLNDGSEGVKAVHLKSGEVWVQKPETALFKDMPENAIKSLPIIKKGALNVIATKINQLSLNHLSIKPMIGVRA